MSSLPIDPDLVLPPSGDELPCEDGIPMDTPRHRRQMEVLIESFENHLWDRHDKYIGGNMFLYYNILQAKRNDFRGPDVFVVLGTDPHERKSWVVWEEDGLGPDVVIELTSPSTEAVDRGDKMRIYARSLGVPEYYLYEPGADRVEGYLLDPETLTYRPMKPTASGRLASARLGAELGLWEGVVRRMGGLWLRCFTPDGSLVPLAAEQLQEEARLRAEEARLRAEEARLRAEAESRVKELEAQVRALRDRAAETGEGG